MDSCEGVYERRSTHFPERVEETFQLNPGGQRGLDMKSDDDSLRLPANKKTILFFRLADGTTAVKMEKSGCPPFWREGFQTMDCAKEFGNHSMDFFRTRVVENKGMKASRKEIIPQRYIDAFEGALDVYYPNEKIEEEIPGRELSRKQRLFKLGTKYGITEMIRIVEEELIQKTPIPIEILDPLNVKKSTEDTHYWARDQISILYEIVKLDRARGYKGTRRGEETCLSNPFLWPEFDEIKDEYFPKDTVQETT